MKKTVLILTLNILITNLMLLGQTGNDPLCFGERFIVNSEILNQERDIYIRLPIGYDTSQIAYPVHFILDGEVTFHIYTGLIEVMAEGNEIQDAIVVGIPNVNRNFDFNPMQNGFKFLEFLTKELVSYIDHEYRTNGRRLLCGYSLGGSYVIFALINAPDSFSSYLAGSPYRLNIFSDDDIDDLANKIQETKTMYTSMGENDRDKEMESYLSFCERLENATIKDLKFKYEVIPNRNHDNSFIINWQDGLEYISNSW